MPSSSRWPQAVLAGFSSSMRTFAAPAALAVRGRIAGPARPLTLLAAAGELAVDKAPARRTASPRPGSAHGSRRAPSAGARSPARPGSASGATGAVVGDYATFRARKLAVAATGLPDPVIAVAEDLVAYSAAAIATHPGSGPELEGGTLRATWRSGSPPGSRAPRA